MEYDKFLIGSTDYRKNFRDGVMRGIDVPYDVISKGMDADTSTYRLCISALANFNHQKHRKTA